MTAEERILKLERQCRLQTFAICATLIVGAVLVFAGAKTENDSVDLKVSRLQVVDADGDVRIELGKTEKDVFGAQFFGSNGKLHTHVLDSGCVEAFNGEGKISLISRGSGAGVFIKTGEKRARAEFYATGDYSRLRIRDATGKVVHMFDTPREKPEHQADPFGG
jgi:hypothetical protein